MYLQVEYPSTLCSHLEALNLLCLPCKILYHEKTTFGKYTGVHYGWVYDYETSQQKYDTWLFETFDSPFSFLLRATEILNQCEYLFHNIMFIA